MARGIRIVGHQVIVQIQGIEVQAGQGLRPAGPAPKIHRIGRKLSRFGKISAGRGTPAHDGKGEQHSQAARNVGQGAPFNGAPRGEWAGTRCRTAAARFRLPAMRFNRAISPSISPALAMKTAQP